MLHNPEVNENVSDFKSVIHEVCMATNTQIKNSSTRLSANHLISDSTKLDPEITQELRKKIDDLAKQLQL